MTNFESIKQNQTTNFAAFLNIYLSKFADLDQGTQDAIVESLTKTFREGLDDAKRATMMDAKNLLNNL